MTLAVLVPFEEKERGVLRGYRIGTYLAERVRGRTPPPEGFLEITPSDVEIPITRHLKVGDFLNHDQVGKWPSYSAINPKLLDKLELVIAEIARWHGEKAVADIETSPLRVRGAGAQPRVRAPRRSLTGRLAPSGNRRQCDGKITSTAY